MSASAEVLATARELARIYGSDAADEARKMRNRLLNRKRPDRAEFWQAVFLALSPEETNDPRLPDRYEARL